MKKVINEVKSQLKIMTKRIGKERAENLLLDILSRYYNEEYEK